MGIGTSLGAYYETSFDHTVGNKYQPEWDKNEIGPDESIQERPAKIRQAVDKVELGGKYLGPHPDEGTPEYDEWNKSWSEIKNIGQVDPESFMKKRSVDEEGTLLPWHTLEDVRPAEDRNKPRDKYMIMRKRVRPNENESVPMSSLPVMQVGYKSDGSSNTLDSNVSLPDVGDPAVDLSDTGKAARVVDRLFGTGGQERYQLWPEKMIRSAMDKVQEVKEGKVPMWAMDPRTGELHTSIEGLESAHELLPLAMGGNMPFRIHVRGEGAKAVQDMQEAASSFWSHVDEGSMSRIRRQPETIGDEVNARRTREQYDVPRDDAGVSAFERRYSRSQPLADEVRSGEWNTRPEPENEGLVNFGGVMIHPDRMSDLVFHRYGETVPEGQMTRAQERRWVQIDRRLADEENYSHPIPPEAERFEQIPLNEAYRTGSYFRQDHLPSGIDPSLHNARQRGFDSVEEYAQNLREERTRNTTPKYPESITTKINEARTSDSPVLIKSPERRGTYYFVDKNGVGSMSLREHNGGKLIDVHTMGAHESAKRPGWFNPNRVSGDNLLYGPETFGFSGTRAILRQLMDEFPKMEEVTGFRVSGARAKTGRGSSQATMRVRPKSQEPVRKDINQLISEWENPLSQIPVPPRRRLPSSSDTEEALNQIGRLLSEWGRSEPE